MKIKDERNPGCKECVHYDYSTIVIFSYFKDKCYSNNNAVREYDPIIGWSTRPGNCKELNKDGQCAYFTPGESIYRRRNCLGPQGVKQSRQTEDTQEKK